MTAPKRSTGVQLGETVARNQILMGSVRVFVLSGYRGCAVQDLLAAANVSRRTFYRFFKSKDDVAVALYQMGTRGLLDACRKAITDETDVMKQIGACVDLHLRTARTMGRLMYVLGGEAHHQESPLYTVRVATHDELVTMLHQRAPHIDPLLIRTLVMALEAITRKVLQDGDEGRRAAEADIARARRVMMRVATGAIAGEGPQVTPLPLVDE